MPIGAAKLLKVSGLLGAGYVVGYIGTTPTKNFCWRLNAGVWETVYDAPLSTLSATHNAIFGAARSGQVVQFRNQLTTRVLTTTRSPPFGSGGDENLLVAAYSDDRGETWTPSYWNSGFGTGTSVSNRLHLAHNGLQKVCQVIEILESVAKSARSKIIKSNNGGETWAAATVEDVASSELIRVFAICFAPYYNKFFACGTQSNGANTIWESADGATFTIAYEPPGASLSRLRGISESDNLVFAQGITGPPLSGGYVTTISTIDGASWTQTIGTQVIGRAIALRFANGPSGWAAVSDTDPDSFTATTGTILKSADGLSWNDVSLLSDPTEFCAVAYGRLTTSGAKRYAAMRRDGVMRATGTIGAPFQVYTTPSDQTYLARGMIL